MPLKPLFITLLSCSSFICLGQKELDGSWTNGWQIYDAVLIPDNKIQFGGGDFHEGGYAFFCSMLTNTKFKIEGNRPGEDMSPSYGKNGWSLEYKRIDSFEVLIARDSNNVFKYFLLKTKPSTGLEEYSTKNKVNFQLAGKYIRPETNDSIIFYPNETRVKWKGETLNYVFGTDYDFPTDAIIIRKTSYYYERSFSTLSFYKSSDDGDEYKKGKFLFKYIQEKSFIKSADSSPGDYSFASIIPLTSDIISFYSLKELKLIRNEIYARHGYIFSNPEVKKYFESKSWYKPVSQDVSGQFSEIELLNIAVIKVREKELGDAP